MKCLSLLYGYETFLYIPIVRQILTHVNKLLFENLFPSNHFTKTPPKKDTDDAHSLNLMRKCCN